MDIFFLAAFAVVVILWVAHRGVIAEREAAELRRSLREWQEYAGALQGAFCASEARSAWWRHQAESMSAERYMLKRKL